MQPSTLAKRDTLSLFAIITGFYFFGLGRLPLVGPDEPRYAQIAREMWQRGDWITPTLGGHVWFEKPALLYWMMIGSFKLFGVSEFAARVPSAVCGLLTITAVFFVARTVERREATGSNLFSVYGVVIAASTFGLIVFARAATFDIVLTMTISWALALFFVADQQESRNRRTVFLAGFYVFIGLSLLAKGFIGVVIPMGVVGAYYGLVRRVPDRLTTVSFLWGIPLTMIVAASWYGPVIARNGWPFIDQFIFKHQLQRYVSNDYRHPGAFYYYFLILPLLTLPWVLFFLEAATRQPPWRRDNASLLKNRLVKFSWAWILFPVIFFSFSRAKLPAYILPVVPAVALVMAAHLALNGEQPPRSVILTAIGFIAGAAALVGYGMITGNLSAACMSMSVPLIAAAVFLLRARLKVSVRIVAAATLIFAVYALYCGAAQFADRESSRRLIQLADERGYGQKLIYGLMPDDRTPEFYAAGRVIYRSDGEPEMYIGPPQLVNETLRRRETLLAFIPSNGVQDLSSAHAATTELIGDNGRHALVAVHPKLK